MNRFQKKRHLPRTKRWILSAGLTVCILGTFYEAADWIETDARRKEAEQLQQALDQSSALCYALEGSYPVNLEYLKEHYGISWDSRRYLVDFEWVGRNLAPDIEVISLEKDTGR